MTETVLVAPEKTLVMVVAGTKRRRRCVRCGEPIDWFATVTRSRTMPFRADVVPLRTAMGNGAGRGPQALLWYLDRADCHWTICPSEPLQTVPPAGA